MPFLKSPGIFRRRSRELEKLSERTGFRHAVISPLYDTYIGEWKNSIKEGKGGYVSRSGQQYEGDWERGFRHGFGVQSKRQENKVFILNYRGDWKNGYPNGCGARHYPDGGYFIGCWKNGKRHGYGQMWYADGGFYDGHWYKDIRQGLGMWVRPDGNRYEGTWVNDVRQGKGRFFHLDNGQMQEGIWKEDFCLCSTVIDIPFRQTALDPTEYPLLPAEVIDYNEIYRKQAEKSLADEKISCLNITSIGSRSSALG